MHQDQTMQSDQKQTAEPPHHYDIVIIGAGMVGAALALKLGRAGFRIALVDRQTPPPFSAERIPELRVSALSAGSEALLRELGAWPAMEAMRFCPYRRLAVWEQPQGRIPGWLPKRFNRTEFSAAEVGHDHLGHIVENSVTQLALWQCLAPLEQVDCLAPAGIAGLNVGPENASVSLDDGTTLTTRLVIGADGAQSRLRELANIGISRSQYRQQALVATVSYQGSQQDITWQEFTPSGPRAFLPLPDVNGRSWASLVWYDHPERLQALKDLPEPAFMNELTRHFPDDLPPLLSAPARASFPLFRSHAQHYCRPRVALAGDAAHTINPLAGQGVNLGFQDVEVLSDVLCRARDQGRDWGDAGVLADYETRRRHANERMMAIMDLFYHGFSNRRPPLYLARNLGLAVAARVPLARREVTRYAMGLDSGLSARALKWLERLPVPPLPVPW